MRAGARSILRPDGVDALIRVLRAEGYETIGPTVRDRVIAIDSITGISDLPIGWGDSQDGGEYRLVQRADRAFFGFAAPAGTWKQYLFPAQLTLMRSRRSGSGISMTDVDQPPPKRAFIGIRGCDLAAIATQDRIFLSRDYPDPHYQARREGLFFVGVNCSDPASTCFCASMDTGPGITAGADIILTELDPQDPARHRFLLSARTDRGRAVAAGIDHDHVNAEDLTAAERVVTNAAGRMQRSLATTGLAQLLRESTDHPRWQEVADRCLSCANCTMVCPTCFCFDVTDEPDAATGEDDRVRRWGSCFERSHSYLHGGSVRLSPQSRYRQWLTHKLSTWWEQFDSSGCVGCGRCITWCPVGIDITEEVAAFQAEPTATRRSRDA
jgi:sulfhydrogenase subunit beta (sulfur reductase)